MIYIVSGTSRAGKTIVSRELSKDLGVPYLSIDWLVMGFGEGIPELNIHHMLMPDVIAKRIWSFLKAMCEGIILNGESCIIDGEAVLPELVIELVNEYPNDIKICFLGYAKISLAAKVEQVMEYAQSNKDWISNKSDAYITDHIQNMLPHSRAIKKSCASNGLKYFDTSTDFRNKLEEVKAFFMS